MTTENPILEVANIIAQQIGQRAFFMLGTQQKWGTEKSLQFNVRGSPLHVNKIIVTLNGSDTYDVEFWKVPVSARAIINGKRPVKVSEQNDVYDTSLRSVISTGTGLAISL